MYHCAKTIALCKSPVRGLAIVGHGGVGFASISNDGVLRTWTEDGELLHSAQVCLCLSLR